MFLNIHRYLGEQCSKYLFESFQSTNDLPRSTNDDWMLCKRDENHQHSLHFNWQQIPICICAKCLVKPIELNCHNFTEQTKSKDSHERPKWHEKCYHKCNRIRTTFRLKKEKSFENCAYCEYCRRWKIIRKVQTNCIWKIRSELQMAEEKHGKRKCYL